MESILKSSNNWDDFPFLIDSSDQIECQTEEKHISKKKSGSNKQLFFLKNERTYFRMLQINLHLLKIRLYMQFGSDVYITCSKHVYI